MGKRSYLRLDSFTLAFAYASRDCGPADIEFRERLTFTDALAGRDIKSDYETLLDRKQRDGAGNRNQFSICAYTAGISAE